MSYDVKVLEKMIEGCTANIKMFMKYGENHAPRVAELVMERRNLAALIENDGVMDANMVAPDGMAYSARAGADTSWWTRGT